MDAKECLPLTLQQRDIWIDHRLNPGNSSYHVGGYYRIYGSIDRRLMARMVQCLIDANDAFRLVFGERNGQPYQRFHDFFEITTAYHDFSDRTDPESYCLEWIRADFNAPFKRLDKPLVEYTLLKAADTFFILYTKQHHLISDGFGLSLQAKQTTDMYSRLARNQPLSVNNRFSYRDQIEDSQAYVKSDRYAEDEAFWRIRFPDVPEPIFELSNPRSLSHSHIRSRRKSIRISGSTYHLFRKTLKNKRLPLFAFMLGLLFGFLHRLTGKRDISIGMPLFNRPSKKAFQTIGLYTGIMPFRMRIDPDIPFLDFVDQVNSELKRCVAHSQFPIGDINRISRKQPNQRLYDICFSYDRSAFAYTFLDYDTTVSWLRPYSQADPLLITVKEKSQSDVTEIFVDYQEDLFDSHLPLCNILPMAESFIEDVMDNLEKTISDLEILSVRERATVLSEFKGPRADYPQNETVVTALESRAVRNPSRIAVVCEDVEMTYDDLNRKANQLATHLIDRCGVNTGDRVAVMLRRSEKMVIGIWGVLKSGAAYIPIDPDYPEERIRYMLEDAAPNAVVTETDLRVKLESGNFASIVDVGIELAGNDGNPDVRIHGDDLAYIIYTSGTTGKPKGAMNTHKGIHNRICWMQQAYGLTPADSVIQKTPFSFDVSVWEFLWPLMFGAKLVVAKPEGHRDPEYLREMIVAHGITTMHFVPSMLHQFLNADGIERCRSLLRVICSGEALSGNTRDRFFLRLGNAELHNLYGPTEAAIDVTAWDCREATDCKSIPIGKPIANMDIYILDDKMRPVPRGVAGEICIGGIGVAVGYWNKPELTRDRFVDNPFRPREKMYRTGDIGRWLVDGNIEFLGRMDDQVKIRGLRIEPRGIENVLLLHEAVEDAAVVGMNLSKETACLVAYVKTVSNVDPDALRRFIGIHLPDYMIPSYFVELDRIPLSPNGKLDKKRLPPPQRHGMALDRDYLAPVNNIESKLVEIWQAVLGVQPIGIGHDFFSLGGDSIRAIEIVHMANERQVPITVADILKHRSIARIAAAAAGGADGMVWSLDPDLRLPGNVLWPDAESIPGRIPAELIETCLPVSRMQEFMIREYTGWHTPGQVYHFQERIRIQSDAYSMEAVTDAVHELVKKHPALRTVFILEGGRAVCQVVRKSVEPVIAFKDIRHLSHNAQSETIALDMTGDRAQPFDISDPEKPLFRIYIYVESDSVFELMLSFHHAIIDGWSNINLLRDFFDLYLKCKSGAPFNTIKNATRSYAHLIALEQESMASSTTRQFWKEHLNAFQAVRLPRISTVSGKGHLNGEPAQIHIDPDQIDRLTGYASRHQIGLKDLFLSVYFDVLCKHCGVPSITIGCVTNRRSEHLIQPLEATGLFWNILPVHMGIVEDKQAQIRSVHRLLARMHTHVMYPLPQIIDDNEDRDLFFATFNYTRFHHGRSLLNVPGIRILTFEFHDKFHFPLNLLVAFHPVQTNIVLRAEFDDRYFTAARVQDMLHDFRTGLTLFK